MAKYAILIYEDPNYYANASPEAWAAVVDAHNTFTKQVYELDGSIAGGEALAFANLASGVTVKKIGTTGTASPAEIIQKFEENSR